MATKTAKWTWKDDYRVEVAGMGLEEITAYLNHFRGQRIPSERTLECTAMLETELANRNAIGAKMVSGVAL